MARKVQRLTDMEFDEISLVDRSANQHATVAIAKRDGEQHMGIYSAEGDEIDEADLQHGDVVYDEQGNEFINVDPEQLDEDDLDELSAAGVSDDDLDALYEGYSEDVEDRQLESVGKSAASMFRSGSRLNRALGSDRATASFTRRGRAAESAFSTGRSRAKDRTLGRAAGLYGRNPAAAIGVAGGTAAGAGGIHHTMKKSLGESVYEELSKALTGGDQAEVISKAFDLVETYREEAAEASAISKALADERDTQAWIQHAQGYGPLPVPVEEVAAIMKNASETLPRSQVEKMDQMFASMGEQLFAEIGTAGGQPSSAYEAVEALASQRIGKSDLSLEGGIVSIFEANPDAYDAYLAETR